MFVSVHSLRAINKYYENQDQTSLEKLCRLANHLHSFILAKLHHMLFALYFATTATRRSPSPDADSVSKTSYGSFSSVEDINGQVHEECNVSETTPLLRTTMSTSTSSSSSLTKDCLNWRSVGLLLMCASSLVLAVYLLWRQTQEPDFGYRLSLIEHDIWSDMDLQGRGTQLDPQRVATVFFTHTASEGCLEDCSELLLRLQRSRVEELPYNFLIAGDCQTFEARGWGYESSYPGDLQQNNSLVMAFVGNFSQRPPSNCQLRSAQALILESLKRHRLQTDYQLYVLDTDAEAVQRELEHWPRYAGRRRTK
ncbi:peptidoglycan-recognition protein LD isoform X1 [Drosophila serrata]|uniref:peptidoglycan-recognition protein LD isoform X1 n=1 Tax=Drosophila serrata TaxID=7274 RepID=UPI000A1CF694|nr:peptidoglycan-recognition protein LD isoform X1 [Drosophila serrata]